MKYNTTGNLYYAHMSTSFKAERVADFGRIGFEDNHPLKYSIFELLRTAIVYVLPSCYFLKKFSTFNKFAIC